MLYKTNNIKENLTLNMSEIQKFTNNEIKITNTVLSCHSSPLSGYMEDWWRPRKGNNLKHIK